MKQLLKKCLSCNLYTLNLQCPKCGAQTHNPHPAKFSPDDKYARYRIIDRYREKPSDNASSDEIQTNS